MILGKEEQVQKCTCDEADGYGREEYIYRCFEFKSKCQKSRNLVSLSEVVEETYQRIVLAFDPSICDNSLSRRSRRTKLIYLSM